MGNSEKPAARLRRKFDVDRSDATRKRLFEAAIECFNRFGYAATTTILIAETAGVSRGAMLHQFATKADMIYAVFDYCYGLLVDEHRRRLAAHANDEERFRSLLRIVWEVAEERYAVALSEIEVGYRSDPELAAMFRPIVGKGQSDRIRHAWVQLARRIGISDLARVEDMAMMHLASVRGLLITRLSMPTEGERLERVFNLLDEQNQRLIDRWLAETPSA